MDPTIGAVLVIGFPIVLVILIMLFSIFSVDPK
jgi:hypothetical protein